MEHMFTIAALWLALAVVSALVAFHLRVSIALVKICVGVVAAAVAGGFGKPDALGACFINDLGTVIALGLLFAPFTTKTVIFVSVTAFVLAILPFTSRLLTRVYGYRTAQIRT